MNYKNSRDAAWQILIHNKITSLPVSVSKIREREKIRLLTYREGAPIIEQARLENNVIGNDAFSMRRMIFYDDTKPPSRQRFSIAHEIGHIILHNPTGATVLNREMSPNDDPLENEANVFASRLLAPLCVLHFLNVRTPEEISELCNISLIAAQIRYNRLCAIRERDRDMRERTGRGCFLLSRLERAVCGNFSAYIEKNKR